ncbi:ABC transporter ATP-binding protein [Arthrobacter sp. H41]|uniref:ABC transporter ATP-binding protein n=1 Tax=Arthrobacter sp. H41 TaxID=1312978 RepID=UPI0004794B89|nr:ABC transporter ATP-binding protein [Arthrobacter sp. H41]
MSTTTDGALTLADVTLEYPDGDSGTLKALDNVSLSVPSGSITSLVGPSGSGKSSLLAVAVTLVRPTSGMIRVGGTETSTLTDAERTTLRREEIGIIFQQPNLLVSLTAAEQLVIGEHLRGASPKAAEARARDLLDVVGLSDAADRRPHQLSGGQRQRVNIARALVGQPTILLVDEPTAALDHERSDSIVRLLCRITRDFSVATVLVTHDTEFVPLTDAVATIRDGRLSAPALAVARPYFEKT